MSGDNPTDVAALRECLDHWRGVLNVARRDQAYAAEREEIALRTIRVMKAKIAAAEAAVEQRIVTEDDGDAG